MIKTSILGCPHLRKPTRFPTWPRATVAGAIGAWARRNGRLWPTDTGALGVCSEGEDWMIWPTDE